MHRRSPRGHDCGRGGGGRRQRELGLDPFEVAPSTIQGWLESHRRTEDVEESGSGEAEQARAIARETIAAIQAKPAAQRTSKELHALEQALRLLRRADREAPRKPAPKPVQRDAHGRTRLEALIAQQKTGKAGESRERPFGRDQVRVRQALG